MTRQPDRMLEPLDEEYCRRLLGLGEVGRLSWFEGSEVFVFPVNYVLDGGDIVIRTRPLGSIAKGAVDGPAAFQVEEISADGRLGWTILAQVRLATVDDEAEERRLDGLGLRPWVTDDRNGYFRLVVSSLSGRRLRDPRN